MPLPCESSPRYLRAMWKLVSLKHLRALANWYLFEAEMVEECGPGWRDAT